MAIVARWRLENNGTDETGNYNLTQTDVTYSATLKVEGNYCGVYNGTSSYGTSADSPIPNTGDWTAAFWSYRNWTSDPTQYVMCTYDTGTTKGFRITYYTGCKWRLVLGDGTAGTYYSDTVPFATHASGWHHVAIVVDRGNGLAHFYCDGSLLTGNVDISAIAGGIDKEPFYLSSNRNVNLWWDGYLDDVRIYNTALSQGEVKDLYDSTKPPAWENYVSRWTLDNTANDETGANNGTATDVTYMRFPRINDGYSGSFNGSTSKISANTANVLNYTNYTISLWAKCAPLNNVCIWSQADSSFSSGHYGEIDIKVQTGNQFNLEIDNDAGSLIYNKATTWAADNKWHHICVTDANGSVLVYIDGQLDSNFTASYSRTGVTTNTFTIGAQTRNTVVKYYTGYIDDVRIYNMALTAEEAAGLYKSYFKDSKYFGGANI